MYIYVYMYGLWYVFHRKESLGEPLNDSGCSTFSIIT